MARQKRIAVVNDVTGFGRCAAAVAQPIISAMKMQACVLPTAVLSMHTGFENFFLHDFTPYMERYMEHWAEHELEFDGISTGFLGSVEQIALVEKFLQMFKREETLVIVDPVMGDYGKLYPSYTDEMCGEMKKLVPYADVLTPNLTEACRLLDKDYETVEQSDEGMLIIAKKLAAMGPDKIVITGLQKEGMIANYIYEKDKEFQKIQIPKIGEDRSGTGDVFTAVVSGSLVKGENFLQAVQRAIDYINKTISYTVQLDIPTRDGLCFEEYLSELA